MADAIAYVNSRGGIAGRKIALDAVDYGYQVPRAIAHYKKWSGEPKVAAIHGWGTANAEALVSLAAKDEIPYFSASYSASLTDRLARAARRSLPLTISFYGSSYSDGARALVIWAAED
ncbi:MAG: ABC transporter substrate-binding protein, partial [Akkermansiaceae bacterium]|nr:ABC transporter substrate-binding protein [Akkermansiaceae bacterium]